MASETFWAGVAAGATVGQVVIELGKLGYRWWTKVERDRADNIEIENLRGQLSAALRRATAAEEQNTLLEEQLKIAEQDVQTNKKRNAILERQLRSSEELVDVLEKQLEVTKSGVSANQKARIKVDLVMHNDMMHFRLENVGSGDASEVYLEVKGGCNKLPTRVGDPTAVSPARPVKEPTPVNVSYILTHKEVLCPLDPPQKLQSCTATWSWYNPDQKQVRSGSDKKPYIETIIFNEGWKFDPEKLQSES